jgi:hypothetical protein
MTEATPEATPENRGAGTLSLEVSAVIPMTAVLNDPDEDMPPIILVMLADGTVRWASMNTEAPTE